MEGTVETVKLPIGIRVFSLMGLVEGMRDIIKEHMEEGEKVVEYDYRVIATTEAEVLTKDENGREEMGLNILSETYYDERTGQELPEEIVELINDFHGV